MKVNLNDGEFIISDSANNELQTFLRNGVSNFFQELEQYINSNDDADIVHYATERTMASLFVSGNLRRDKELTGIQEYGTICTRNGVEVTGRPDIFMNYKGKAIWIECKYERMNQKLPEDHWDIPGWLEWDKRNAFSQVETYYNSEAKNLNACYNERYLVTLHFKLIKENKKEHNKLVETHLKAKVSDDHERLWYYQVGFINSSENESFGLEVFGTCSENLVKITEQMPVTSALI